MIRGLEWPIAVFRNEPANPIGPSKGPGPESGCAVEGRNFTRIASTELP